MSSRKKSAFSPLEYKSRPFGWMVRNRSLITVSRGSVVSDPSSYVIYSRPWSRTWLACVCTENKVKQTNKARTLPPKSIVEYVTRTPWKQVTKWEYTVAGLKEVITGERTFVCRCGTTKLRAACWFTWKKKINTILPHKRSRTVRAARRTVEN